MTWFNPKITLEICLNPQISSITADNVDVYKNAVTKLTDCMDANIKVMYTIMAKTEEVSNRFKNTEKLAARMWVEPLITTLKQSHLHNEVLIS